MKIPILENSIPLARKLGQMLLFFGIKGEPFADKEEFLNLVKEEPEINTGLLDIDNKVLQGLTIMEEIHQLRGDDFRFIVHSAREMGDLKWPIPPRLIIGHIGKPFDEARAFSSLNTLLSTLPPRKGEKRQHIRVTPDPENLPRVHFKLPGNQGMISGKIINISLGGLAAELFDASKIALLKENQPIPQVQFNLNYRLFTPGGKIILKRGKIFALHFDKFNTADKTILAKYIYDRL